MSGDTYEGALDARDRRVVPRIELVNTTTGLALSDKIDAYSERHLLTTAQRDKLDAIQAVVDNLSSSDTTAPLSANQGRVLNDLINGIGDGIVVADMAARDALTGLDVGDMVTVEDRGDGKWADYKVVSVSGGTTGTTATFVARLDQDTLAGASTATNLTFARDTTTVTVESSSGTNAVLPAATASDAGVMTAAQVTALNNTPQLVVNLVPTDNTTTAFAVNHGITGRNVSSHVRRYADGAAVLLEVTEDFTGTASFTFGTAPAGGNQYELVTIGA